MSFWLRLHTIGWFIWVPVTSLFVVAILWARTNAKARGWVPWMFLAALLGMAGADYARSDWHHVLFSARRLWLGGVLAMLAHASLPLLVSLLMEALLAPRQLPAWQKGSIIFVCSITATILFGYSVSHGIQVFIRGG